MPAPELLWTIFARGLGVIYLIAFASLLREIRAYGFSDGIAPVAMQLERIARDFPRWKRFAWFPSVFWLAKSDRALVLWLWLGIAAATSIVLGGPLQPLAFLVCFSVFLSYDLAVDLVYPWDAALLEASVLALFLVKDGAPPEAIAWAYRFLLARIVLGFGKMKFFGGGKLRFAYLKSFVIGQPIPNWLGYHAYRLPLAFFVVGLVGLAFTELVAPILIFITPETRLVAAACIAGLMATIQLTGNFGFFNVLVMLLCVPLLDVHGAVSLAGLAAHPFATAYATLYLVLGVISFPFVSWVARSWTYWPALASSRIVAFVRALAPFRLAHAYGVFGPDSLPAVKWVPVIEASNDGVHWLPYETAFMPSSETSRPRVVAPFMPRWDHFLLYEAFGISLSGFSASLFGTGNPYRFSKSSQLVRAMQRLLEGNAAVETLFAKVPMRRPKYVRAICVMLEPTMNSARPWRRQDLHVHVPPMTNDGRVFDEWLRDPAGFHPDDVVWRRRAGVRGSPSGDWRTDERAFNERVLSTMNALQVTLPTQFHRHLFAAFLVSRDAHAKDAALHLPDFTPERGLAVLATHWKAPLVLAAKKARLTRFTMPGHDAKPPPIMPGFSAVAPDLERLFPRGEDERLPAYAQTANGLWLPIAPP